MENKDIITRPNGTQYEYDADFDVYRRVPEPINHAQRWGWIYVCAVLGIVCAIIPMLKA